MSKVFFIGDLHLGHRKIINFLHDFRPFKTIEEHNEELVRRWNSVVSKNDKVFVLGDVVFGRDNLKYLEQMNGTKVLIAGNHDLLPTEEYLQYFTKVQGAAEYKGMLLTHIPVHENQFPRYSHNIHGHLHAHNIQKYEADYSGPSYINVSRRKDPRYINVSAEQINLTPISYDEIINKINFPIAF